MRHCKIVTSSGKSLSEACLLFSWIFAKHILCSGIYYSHKNLVHMRQEAYWTTVANFLAISFLGNQHCSGSFPFSRYPSWLKVPDKSGAQYLHKLLTSVSISSTCTRSSSAAFLRSILRIVFLNSSKSHSARKRWRFSQDSWLQKPMNKFVSSKLLQISAICSRFVVLRPPLSSTSAVGIVPWHKLFPSRHLSKLLCVLLLSSDFPSQSNCSPPSLFFSLPCIEGCISSPF